MIVRELIDEERESKIDAMRLKAFRTNDKNDRESLFYMLVKWFGERTDRRMDADIAARNGPANTCPASRHAAMIAEALITGQGYPMLTEDPAHCGETIAAVVGALWAARSQLAEALAMLDDTTTLHRIVADIREKSGVGSKPMLADLAGAIGDKLANAMAVNEELLAAVAIAEDYAHRAEAERAAQLQADGWQPIETAPKAGAWFVARNSDHPNWGSWPMKRRVVWARDTISSEYVMKDCGGWIHIIDDEPSDCDDPNHVQISVAMDQYNESVTYEWRPLHHDAQPHDRTALDAVRRAAKVEAWKEAADLCQSDGWGYKDDILALIGEGV